MDNLKLFLALCLFLLMVITIWRYKTKIFQFFKTKPIDQTEENRRRYLKIDLIGKKFYYDVRKQKLIYESKYFERYNVFETTYLIEERFYYHKNSATFEKIPIICTDVVFVENKAILYFRLYSQAYKFVFVQETLYDFLVQNEEVGYLLLPKELYPSLILTKEIELLMQGYIASTSSKLETFVIKEYTK